MNEMEATEVLKKTKPPTVDPALCRGCRHIKKCRLMTTEYDWMGCKEVYSDMFMDVFGLLLSNLDGDEKDSCICATCVLRLREARSFRTQVLQSEEIFLEAKLHGNDDTIMEDLELKVEIKNEVTEADNDDGSDDIEEVPCSGSPAPQPPEDDMPIDVPDNDKIEESQPQTTVDPETLIQQALEEKVNKLQDKLDQMLDKPVQQVEKPQQKSKPKQTDKDQDLMAYTNTVIIVNNSYVCPFHTRISIYYCFYCKDQFTNPTELREHTLQHDPKPLFENTIENKKIPKIDITRIDCRLCDTKIDDLDTFKDHITNVHGIDIYPVTNEFLKFKLTLHTLTCTECDRTFPFFDALKKHMIEHFGTLICDVCGACFLEQTSLRTHIKSHTKTEAFFPCEVCGKNLKSKYSRYLHIATVHEKRATVNCYKCDASFLSYALRNRHLIEVHGDKRTFPCKLCDKVYNRRKTMMEHVRRNHQKVRKHQCHLCDQKFYLPSRLKEHMATHTGERNYKCEVCDKTYPRSQSYQDHVRTHITIDKKYKCNFCPSAFSQHLNWKNHLKNHHTVYGSNSNYT